MGFVREVDRALTNTVMSEFIRLQFIMGEDLSKALRAMHTDLEASTDDLIRDLDMVSMNTMGIPSENSAAQVALKQYRKLIKLRITLPLAKLDAAHEDMDRFLWFHLEDLQDQMEMQNLIRSLAQWMADHDSRICQLVFSADFTNIEVALRVIFRVVSAQPVESNFFSGILEGLLGRLGIAAPGVQDPPASSQGVPLEHGQMRYRRPFRRGRTDRLNWMHLPPQECLQYYTSILRKISSAAGASKCLRFSLILHLCPSWLTRSARYNSQGYPWRPSLLLNQAPVLQLPRTQRLTRMTEKHPVSQEHCGYIPSR